MERVLLFWLAWLVPPISLFLTVFPLCGSRSTVVGTALAILLYVPVARDPIGPLSVPWQFGDRDRSTGNDIEVGGRPPSSPSHSIPPPWFRETVPIVRRSIVCRVTAQVDLSFIVVYKRLRIRRRD